MTATIQPGAAFKDNLAQLPPVGEVTRIDLRDAAGTVVATIPNEAGKQGSLALYQHLAQTFAELDIPAAEYGLALFAEHTADARQNPGAHPNVDRLLGIAAGGEALRIEVVGSGR